MDVTHAIGSSAGAQPAIPPRASGRIRDKFVRFLRDPVQEVSRHVEQLPFDYPPAVIVVADVALFVVSVGAVVQRYEYFPTLVPFVAALFAFLPWPVYFFLGLAPRPMLLGLYAMGSTALFLIQPVAVDFAPFVLVVTLGEIASIASKRVTAILAVAMIGELAAFDVIGNLGWSVGADRLQGLPMYSLGIVLGGMVGVMMQYQRKFLYQEREYQAVREVQVAAEERRRIAREVHDVIAHSLSVTLLHLTAARHSLQTDRDVDEAVDALVDAERLGRQAMADIRRTVGLLDGAPSKLLPEPGVEDIGGLVDDFVRAGLDVEYTTAGDLRTVSAALGLALYRSCQESLANIVKHAPGASASVRLEVDRASVALSVHNPLTEAPPQEPGTGMGLSGMRQRAVMLGGEFSAGRTADGWSVHAQFPLTGRSATWCGPMLGLLRGSNPTGHEHG